MARQLICIQLLAACPTTYQGILYESAQHNLLELPQSRSTGPRAPVSTTLPKAERPIFASRHKSSTNLCAGSFLERTSRQRLRFLPTRTLRRDNANAACAGPGYLCERLRRSLATNPCVSRNLLLLALPIWPTITPSENPTHGDQPVMDDASSFLETRDTNRTPSAQAAARSSSSPPPGSAFDIRYSQFAIPHSNPGPLGSGRGAIILVAATLMAIGLVMVGSATVSLDRPLFGPRLWTTPLGRQFAFVLCGLGICLATARLSLPLLASAACRRRIPVVLLLLSIALLVLVLIPGLSDASHGSQRWLRFNAGGIAVGVQPSEIAKLALIAFLAALLGEAGRDPRSFFRGFVPATLAIGLCVGLVGKENFGTAALLGCAAGAILFAASCRLHHLIVVAGLGVSGMVVLLLAEPYRLARLNAYQDFWNDAQGAGYQPLQSLTTIASGGWFGAGLGSGIQKYGYLPESHTDFVFAILCEELGVLGGAMVILLFCGFVWLGLRSALRARTRFEFLLAFGLTFIIGLQAAMNIAVVTVLTPTTGVPLPLVSAGGSGLFTVCAAVGLLSAIAARGSSLAVQSESFTNPAPERPLGAPIAEFAG